MVLVRVSFPLLAILSSHKQLLDMDSDLVLECIQCQLCAKIEMKEMISIAIETQSVENNTY